MVLECNDSSKILRKYQREIFEVYQPWNIFGISLEVQSSDIPIFGNLLVILFNDSSKIPRTNQCKILKCAILGMHLAFDWKC